MDDDRQLKRMPWIDRCVKNKLAWWLSPTCLLCGGAADSRGICPACLADLPRIDNPCSCCGAELGGPGCCGSCQRRPPAYDHAIAPYRYAWPVDQLIQGLKYHGNLIYAYQLGQLLTRAVAAGLARQPDVIIPVPLHPGRLRQRGFNQALEIAKPVARVLGVPIARDKVRRIRNTPPQAELPGRRRRGNVRHAFAVPGDLCTDAVAVVDDVMTSGETVHAVARCLRAAGAPHVQVWVVTRA